MSRSRSSLVFLLICVVLVPLGAPVVQAAPSASTPAPAARRAPVPWTLAAGGDAIITRRVMQFDHEGDPGFQGLLRWIRRADAATLNLELSLIRFSEFKGWPEVENGGNWEVGPPEGAQELKDMGFRLFARANNHATDYGVEGMRVTDRLLDRLDIAHAGTGDNLGLASRPAYFDTAKGRIALISLATTFTPMSRAGAVRQDMVGRPGINALRVDRKYLVDRATLGHLRELALKLGPAHGDLDDPDQVRIFGTRVEASTDNRIGIVESLNRRDVARILAEVKEASQQADFVLVHCHCHEPDNFEVQPPPWLVEFAHRCVDEGATAFIGHGPHRLRPVEIYKERPIFYSLGNFIFHNETIDPMPADAYEAVHLPETALAADLYEARFEGGKKGFPSRPPVYQSVLALPSFEGTRLVGLKLIPIDLARTAPPSRRGTPRLADAPTARAIVERLREMSAPFGTSIVLEGGVGVVRVGQGARRAR